ncbi:fumarylacetoacetate hydrolase domain-containing protein 2A [Drechmeria coniospora]|uniref:Fumarylacetoacetate hydrolase domain-containing protein 2A n=1 Tax=Drechmeria coniospora TaxID=98403 RepID=A0A151GG32_DRECN|nr:fumarylacetoacetate hydrolase domain-containing protein 2A [Drechmeria coniospora]KYK56026.1 fumarylacetoacetate hydrolase domain-containing protein 2A [Drechmeria coniospora]
MLPQGVTDVAKSKRARIISGDVFGKHHVTDQIADIRRLLPPLSPSQVGTVRCLGLNYADHAKETKMESPRFPILFYKPPTALSGPVDAIPIHPMAQEGTGLDHECELVVVIGKRCTDVPESGALDCVLGYAVGNDVSHRDWQIKHGGSQWSHGKGFDGWAPYGPGIVSGKTIRDPQILKIWTKVNGNMVQNGTTANMVFSVKKIISLLSRGVTLMPGDIIFTGTPAGVGMGRTPPVWLEDRDVVEVGLEGVGTCTNKVEFAKPKSKV